MPGVLGLGQQDGVPRVRLEAPVEESFDQDFGDEVMESIEHVDQEYGMESGVEVWGDCKREWTGWVDYRKSVERRCVKRSYTPDSMQLDGSDHAKKIRT